MSLLLGILTARSSLQYLSLEKTKETEVLGSRSTDKKKKYKVQESDEKQSLLNLIIGGRPDSENLPSSGHCDWLLIPELFALCF